MGILADLMLGTFMTKHGASKQPVMAGALSRQGRAMSIPILHRLTESIQTNGKPIS